MKLYVLCFSLIIALALPSVAGAQTSGPPEGGHYMKNERATKAFGVTPLTSVTAAANGDSLKNGTLVGAVLLGAGAFTFAMWLCHNISEEGDPPCWKGSAVLGAAGAGAGALIGAGIDKALNRRTVVGFRVRW